MKRLRSIHFSTPGLFALLALGCSSETPTPPNPMNAGGASAGAAGSTGAPPVGGSAPIAGAPAAGAPVAGAPSAGAPPANGGSAPVAGTGAGGSSGSGTSGSGGSGTGGSASGSGGMMGAAGSASGSGGSGGGSANAKFSFFVTSVAAMKQLSKSEKGFGGDLRYGEATGLAGADKICKEIAELGMPGAGKKEWRAFLSTVSGGPNGGPVHAIDRVGEGPWYDRLGRLIAMNKADLSQDRPRGADPAIIDDLPNEHGVPNGVDGAPGCTRGSGFGMGGGIPCPDNHQILTGTGKDGKLYKSATDWTCNDWTSKEPAGSPWCGHSWPREVSGTNWMSSAADGGCAPCVMLEEKGGVSADCVGSAGGYGGIYCFALTP